MSFWDFYFSYSQCPLFLFYICSFLFYTDTPVSSAQTVIYIKKANHVTYGNTTIVKYPDARRKVYKKSIISRECI